MKKLTFIILIPFISLSIISCSDEKEEFTTADNTTTSTSDNTTATSTLSAPSGLSASGAAGQVTLAWTALSGASSYTMFWGTASGITSSNTAVTSISTNSYTHTGRDNGTSYYYKVAAVNSAGTGTLSSEVSASTPLPAPVNFTATAGSAKVTLDWGAVSGATSYTIYWDTTSEIGSSDTAITSVSTDNYTHSSLTNGTTYYYKVAAVVASGTGTLSSEANATPSSTWAQQAYVKAVNRGNGNQFGGSVALDGDTLAVGATKEGNNQTTITNGTTASSAGGGSNSGAVYVYKRTGTSWEQEAYIKAANRSNGDQFGYSVSLSGDTLAVSALYERSDQTTITNGTTASSDNSNYASGAVYVYKRTGTSWAQEAYVKAYINRVDNYFGMSVALDGDTLAVVSQGDDSDQTTITNGATASSDTTSSNSGAVYVYKRTGTSWAQEAYIKAANNDANESLSRVALSGDTLAMGAFGEDSNQTTITNGTTASSNNSSSGSGAVYVYKRTGTSWAQEAYVKAANRSNSDQFGYSVSLSGDTLAVSTWYEDSNQTTITNGTTASSNDDTRSSGAVYVYKRTGTSWAQEAYVKAYINAIDYYFGMAVALDGDTLAVGARGDDSNQTTITNGSTASSDTSSSHSGAVYVYKRTGTSWAQEAYIKAANNDANEYFSGNVALSGDTLAVGAFGEDSNQTTITNGTTASSNNSSSASGAAYIYLVQ